MTWSAGDSVSIYRRGVGRLVFLLILAIVLAGAGAARGEGLERACPAATEKTVECMSFYISGGVSFEASGEKGGLDREDLRSAYNLPATGGSGQTVAIVDAYNDPNAESDLKTYRSHYGLSECTTTNGCFQKVNQKGEAANYPANESGWSTEISLDLDMVSAVCPECHILLVEASNEFLESMEIAENEAATLKATEISDSWDGVELAGESSGNSAFEHSGIPIVVAAADHCYVNECIGYSAPSYPAVVPSVISVGGTSLKKAMNSRGWSESVWFEPKAEIEKKIVEIGTGSGCSVYESKPSWETDKGCADRTDNDVAAVGACNTPLSIYDSYERAGWLNECGTSASAPIIAGIEALSTSGARKEGAEAFWKLGAREKLFDVTEGSNFAIGSKSCGSYLCEAKVGYDGPSGWGTPDGVLTAAPAATTGSATGVTEEEATIHGDVNPEGVETKYYFEYGTSKSFGSKTAEASAGSGTANVEVSKALTGLKPATSYYYRLVAVNSEGDKTFGEEKLMGTAGKPVAEGTTPASIINSSTSEQWVFYVDTSNEIAYWHVSSSTKGWVNGVIGGSVKTGTSPTAVFSSSGVPFVYYVNTSGEIAEWTLVEEKWKASTLGGKVAAGSSPNAVSSTSSVTQFVFYVNSSNEIEYFGYGGTWSKFTIGGKVKANTSPTSLINASGGVFVYYVNSSDEIANWTLSGTWQAATFGGKVAEGTSPSSAVNLSNGFQYVPYVNSSHEIAYFIFNGSWTSGTVGGKVKAGTSPTITLWSSASVFVFYTNSSGEVANWTDSSGTWVGAPFGGEVLANSSPVAEQFGASQLFIFYAGASQQFGEFVFDGGWTGPNILPL